MLAVARNRDTDAASAKQDWQEYEWMMQSRMSSESGNEHFAWCELPQTVLIVSDIFDALDSSLRV